MKTNNDDYIFDFFDFFVKNDWCGEQNARLTQEKPLHPMASDNMSAMMEG